MASTIHGGHLLTGDLQLHESLEMKFAGSEISHKKCENCAGKEPCTFAIDRLRIRFDETMLGVECLRAETNYEDELLEFGCAVMLW